jgi:multicomponent Na+:H+ antiporter subunit B
MVGLIIFIIFMALILLAFVVIAEDRLPHSVILFMGFGLGSTILYFLFSAPDVALTEAVIGSALTGIVLLISILKTKRGAL